MNALRTEESLTLSESPERITPTETDASGNPLAIYLRDIGAVPLLTPAEERELADCIQRGRKAIGKLESCSEPARRDSLLEEAAQGADARRRLIEANLRLVVSVARRYAGRELPLGDLIEEGNIGLMRAADKFDPSRGFRFSTYAIWWIRQAVTRALLNHGRVVRLPVQVSETMTRISHAGDKLSQQLGREPSNEELAQEVGIKKDRLREIIKASQQTVSLEQPYGEGGLVAVSDVLEDTETERPEEQVSREMLCTELRVALGELTERERRVVSLRYGLDDDSQTLDEVGVELGVSRERVRQMEKEALEKLRRRFRESPTSLR